MLDEDNVIMVISTTCLEVPPDNYGGTEQMVYNLTKELADRGYDVTCVAPQGTEIEGADIIETVEPDDSQNCFHREPEAFDEYAPYMPDCDIVIDHSWQKLSYIGKHNNQESMSDTEIMGVWHGMPSVREKPPVENPNYVSVSKAAASAWQAEVGFETRHVYNSVDFDYYSLQEDKSDYYITLNRIMPEKGIKEAIQVARQTGINLKVVGEDQFVDDPSYVSDVMKMCAESDNIKYRGTVDQDEKLSLLQDAKGVFLFPKKPYQEVFGLAAVEAMACGTPVIATNNNGLGEVVSRSQTWGLVGDIGEASQYIEQIESNSSSVPEATEIRENAKALFSMSKMADLYLQRAEEAKSGGW